MPEVGQLWVSIGADAKDLQKALDTLNKATKNIQTKFNSLGSRLSDTFSKLTPVLRTIGKGLAAAGAAAVGGLGAAGGAAIKMAADLEQSKMAFTTLLGSAQEADAFLKQLADFAATTPFEMAGLQDASRKLLAFGFESQKIIPMMRAIGDAVGALGGGAAEIDRVTFALGQMQAKGKVSAEEMMQLAELGIPAWEMLASKIGVSIPEAMEMASKGAIPAAEGINAILQGMTERFGGAMQQQATTINGLWSTLKDTGMMVLQNIGTQLIQTFDLQGKLQGLVDWLTANQDKISGFITRAIQVLGDAWNWFSSNVWPLLQQAFSWIQQNAAPALQGMGETAGRLGGVFQEKMLPALQKVWDFIVTFVETVSVIWDRWGDDILQVVETVFGRIGPIIEGVFTVLTGILDTFIGIFTGDWSRFTEGISKIWSGLWDTVTNVLGGLWDLFKGILGSLWENFTGWWQDLFDWLVGNSLVPDMVNKVAEWIGKWPGKIKEFLSNVKGHFENIWNGIKDTVRGAINGIIGFINRMIDGWNNLSFSVPAIEIPFVGKVGGFNIDFPNIPKIPMLAEGGIVLRPTLALIGEAGPEAVLPLKKLDAFEPPALPPLRRAGREEKPPVHIDTVNVAVHARDLREVEDVLDLFRNLRQAARAGA